eukprot:6365449-Amphidinium_carterae.1
MPDLLVRRLELATPSNCPGKHLKPHTDVNTCRAAASSPSCPELYLTAGREAAFLQLLWAGLGDLCFVYVASGTCAAAPGCS